MRLLGPAARAIEHRHIDVPPLVQAQEQIAAGVLAQRPIGLVPIPGPADDPRQLDPAVEISRGNRGADEIQLVLPDVPIAVSNQDVFFATQPPHQHRSFIWHNSQGDASGGEEKPLAETSGR